MVAFFSSILGIGREDGKDFLILFSYVDINCRKLAINFPQIYSVFNVQNACNFGDVKRSGG